MMRLAAAALLAVAATLSTAQLPMDAPLATGTTYSRTIPSPEAALGFRTGTRYARSHEITEYFRLVGEKSPRVRVGSFGRSWEGRDLTYAIVSAPENLRRLDAIREANRRLVFESDKVTDDETNAMPIIIWSGYGVHGNEPSGPDAALLVLYHLAAGGREVENMLQNMVVILGPNYNPDGRERYVGRANAFRGLFPSDDPFDLEHTETWPAGRTNHYFFDLNRDWLPLTQPESSLRHAEYVRWRPQVTLDFHEMGGTSYFFQPGEPNRVNPLTPRSNQEWTRLFATYHARALESVGERYFIERRFDDFYPGKGSTYPDLVGSIGILFEQSGTRGMFTDRGSHRQTYVSTVRNQVACTLSSLQAAHEHRVALLRHQRDQFRGPRRPGGWMLADSLDGLRLARLLRKHEIEVYRWGRRLFVPANQPLHLLAEAMLTPPDRFADNQFYDISTWGLGHAFRTFVEHLDEDPTPPASRTFLIEDEPEPRGGFRAADRPLGYLIYRTYGQFYGAVSDLQAAGRRVHFVTKRVGPASPGEVFVPASDLASDNALMERIARERGVIIHGVEGQTGEIANWGGSELVEINTRRIGLIAESGADLNLLGELWWRMNAHHRFPVTLTNSSTDLTRFDTVIFCGSTSSGVTSRLAAFVEQGGTLVAVGAGAIAVAGSPVWEIESVTYRPDTSALPYSEVAAESGRHEVPGTILAVQYDTTHPLTFGARPGAAFREGGTFLVPPSTAAQVVGRYGADPVVAGYLSPEVAKLAAGKASVLARRSGQGRVILFADAPAFRGFFTSQEDLFLNAVFFSQAF